MEVTCPHCHERMHYSGKRPGFCAYCGQALPATVEDATVDMHSVLLTDGRLEDDPTEIGGYRLIKRLGEGGMGRVYEAEDIATGQRVAVKLISAKYANSPVALERFRREGRLASGVAHPRCVFIYAADEAMGRPYIVMELMPGATLQDRVDQDGPMPVEIALPMVLDVIDGLRELHRLGIVHRDVKPSNCLIDAGGRVKVADFGLSRSLVESSAVTQTGSFVGTPLFASPEQIKGTPVSPRSDVYSAAATLYCLLTGQAPFQGNDPAATLARIASESAPPMRSLQPALSESLDQVVLRGLEREPTKRWGDIEEFRQALEAFAPGRLSFGGLGVRFGAYLIDSTLVYVLGAILGIVYNLAVDGLSWTPHQPRADQQIFGLTASTLLWFFYFGGSEWKWSSTLGKYLLGLRVSQATRGERPARAALALRTTIFFFCTNVSTLTIQLLYLLAGFGGDLNDIDRTNREGLIVLGLGSSLTALGIALLVSTMRARNGYRGLHEWLSGTRVVRLPVATVKNVRWDREPQMRPTPLNGLPDRLGPFDLVGVLARTEMDSLVLGFDASLGRNVWIWLRPGDGAALGDARRNLTRTTRMRWLAGGRDGASQWDAFVAPDSGASVAGPPPRPLDWEATRHLLTQLADELDLASSEGTLPAMLSPAQVWVWPDGRIALLDMAAVSAEENHGGAPLRLLAQTAAWALNAKPHMLGTRFAIGLPLPCYATAILERLLSDKRPYASVAKFQADLTAVADRPSRTTRWRRLGHLALMSAFLYFGLCMGLVPIFLFPSIAVMALSMRIRWSEGLQEQLLAVTACDAANAVTANDPLARLSFLARADEDARLHKRFSDGLALLRKERDARAATLDSLSLTFAETMERGVMEKEKRGGRSNGLPGMDDPARVRAQANQDTEHDRFHTNVMPTIAVVSIILAAAGPVIWVLWAFVVRGGISYYIMGLALVRRDGRPALRIQCAWRALLVWGPFAVLAVASVGLDYLYWESWYEDAATSWLLRASHIAGWACVALIPLYGFLALYTPQRTIHDLLAGTHIVPR